MMEKVLVVIRGIIITIILLGLLLHNHLLNLQKEIDLKKIINVPVYYDKDNYYNEDSADLKNKGYYILYTTLIVDTSNYRKGDTIYVDHYSDNVIDLHYSDGETYIER